MLIEIEGQRTGSIVMFGNVATTLLKMMGQSGQPKGALREEDIPEALSKLKKAIESLPSDEKNDKYDDEDESVGIKTRAIPLLKILQECVEKGGYLMWKPQ